MKNRQKSILVFTLVFYSILLLVIDTDASYDQRKIVLEDFANFPRHTVMHDEKKQDAKSTTEEAKPYPVMHYRQN